MVLKKVNCLHRIGVWEQMTAAFWGEAGRCVGTSGQVTVLFIILTAKN